MLPSQTLTLTVPRNWLDLYETIWQPTCFAKWVSDLKGATLVQEGQYWRAKRGENSLKLRFTPHNPFGVMDYWTDNGSGKERYMPMRVIANGQGAELVAVLYCQPFTSDAHFVQEVAALRADMERLLYLLTH